MKKVVLFVLLIYFMFSFSMIVSATPTYGYITGETYDYINLSDTSVAIRGYTEFIPGEINPECTAFIAYFTYWEEGSDVVNTIEHGFSSQYRTDMIYTIEDLKPSTTYYYKANGGKIKSFTTLPYPQPKTMTVVEPTDEGYSFDVGGQSLTPIYDKVYISLYKDDEFVGTISKIFYNNINLLPTSLDFDYAKVMVWNKDTMAPVTAPEIVYNPFN